MKNKKINITPNMLFFIVSISGILAFLIFAFVNSSMSSFDWLIMQHNSTYTFADYFYHIFYGRDLTTVYNAYDVDPCFPPLSYLIYHYMFRIAPVDNMTSLKDVINYPYYLFIFMIFSSVLLALFCFAIQIYNENSKMPWKTWQSMLLVITAIMSVPFGASALERGNSAFIVVILLMFVITFKDSENPILRELALVLIAVAANFKLYPAIFGLLYLKEKRFKEAIRLVIYGVAFFLVPFIFFDGLKSIKEYLIIIRLMQGRSCEQATTVRGVVTSFVEMLKGPEAKWTGHAIGKVVENIYLIIALVAFYFSTNKWKEMYLLVSPMVVYVTSAYRYTSIYFFLALLIFMSMNREGNVNEAKWQKVLNYVYAVLFGLIFSVPIYAYGFELENVMYFYIYLMLVIIWIDLVAEKVLARKQN